MEYSIYGALILITLLCLWAVITIPKNYLFKSILIPTMLVIAISTWFTYTALLGFGTTFKPSEAVVYHYHISDKKNDRIYVLVTELKEKEPRLHIFPWSEKLKEELDIEVCNATEVGIIHHQYSHMKLSITLFDCKYKSGTVKPLSSQEIKWITYSEKKYFAFPSATHKLFKIIKEVK